MRRLIELLIEQHKFKRSMRELARLQWSTDYIIYLLRKSQIKGITMRVHEPSGRVIEITANDEPSPDNNYIEREYQMTQDEWDVALGLRSDI